jgi:tetratricopeptide (TPR) repeat protein
MTKSKDDLYYDAMECLEQGKRGVKKAEKMLFEAVEADEHYVQTYIGLAQIYGVSGNRKKAREAIIKAYDKTIKKFPKWPEKLEWGFLENRAYLRAIQHRADLFWDDGESDKAVKLFRLLLRLNPNDNQGVRYEISALYVGISGDKLNEMFDEGNSKQNWNKLEKLVKEENSKHHFWEEPIND